jgi:hypothetical protein
MNISDRYRQLVTDARDLHETLSPPGSSEPGRELRSISLAVQELAELQEKVGEIPRIRLESQLTPVLLKAHGYFDRARLLLEEDGREDQAAAVWDMEQKVYRLLNEL